MVEKSVNCWRSSLAIEVAPNIMSNLSMVCLQLAGSPSTALFEGFENIADMHVHDHKRS